MMAALKRMTPRDRGSIVNVGSALAYRSVPLQSVYCGAKFAIRGFTDSLRSEIYARQVEHLHSAWWICPRSIRRIRMGSEQDGQSGAPVPPIFQPEIAARAIYFAAFHPRRQTWIGFPTVKAILANRIAPGLIDRYLARVGYSGQLTRSVAPDAPNNLFQPVPGDFGATAASTDGA